MNEDNTQRLVRAILDRAEPELRRRREAQRFGIRLFRDLERRSTPLAAAAAMIALVSTLAMTWFGVRVDPVEAQVPTLAASITPDAYTDWVDAGERPDMSALLLEFDVGAER